MIAVIGIGPGCSALRSFEAQRLLEAADILLGYELYVKLLRQDFPEKAVFSTAMTEEIDRCREALRLSREGRKVALVCSGDAALYGMAALLLELADARDEIEIVPGITAAWAASALLGAPLALDTAIISLSDLLTPWEKIEKRLDCAAQGDFCLAIYNPASRKRKDHLARAAEIILRHQPADLPCGWVRNAYRDDSSKGICRLAELAELQVDMFTTVIVGNRATKILNGKLVTPRGYRK